MAFKVAFAEPAENDFDAIFAFLVESYLGFGESPGAAIEHALQRVQSIRADAGMIGRAPYHGTLHDDIARGLRHVTIGRAIFWFKVFEELEEVRVLGVFFGGQDHQRRMLVRLLQ